VGNTLAEFERDLTDNLCYQRGTTAESASAQDAYWTLAVTVRDRLADRRARTARANYEANPKFVYYLSAEYMLGRQLRQNALYTGTADLARQAVAASGYSMTDLDDLDVEPGLGNGGLGRLAACLLDSLATSDMPAVGYGIRYEFGIFKQAFEDGYQVEHPDDWTFYGNPWEFPAPDDLQVVGFYGHTEAVEDDPGGLRARWVPGEMVRGEPSHMLVPGYGTETVNILRLWRARAGQESFDLGLFNAGRYAEAVEAQMRSENLTKVLYPSDSTDAGKELRLKQQYFLVSCSLRDIIRRFRFRNSDWEAFPDQVVIQLNDTHRCWPYPSSCACWSMRTGSAGSKPGPSPAVPSPTPATPCCPKPWRPGRCRCSGGCCPVIWRSSTPSIASSLRRCARGIRVTRGVLPGCR
jgi:starch phosphorylase